MGEEEWKREAGGRGRPPIYSEEFDAVVFDLDGVITDTAEVHYRAWKEVFDARLKEEGDLRPFDREDYLAFVDGKPRAKGIRSFLASRQLRLEGMEALGEAKNRRYQERLMAGEARLVPGALDLVEQLLCQGIKTALVSSSRNAARVLEALNLEYLFDERVDGMTLEAQEMAGKPAPDMILEAIWRLGVRPQRAVVIEDARSGIAAGKAAGVGMVIGVATDPERARVLLMEGADVTVENLGELLTYH